RHRRMGGQGGRLRDPGPRAGLHRPSVGQLLRRDGPATVRDRTPAAPVRAGGMSDELLVNVTPRETRVAVVENGMLQELHIERGSQRGVVGNSYEGKVQRVAPGMQAAFVDLGLERAAFLHANDISRSAQLGP